MILFKTNNIMLLSIVVLAWFVGLSLGNEGKPLLDSPLFDLKKKLAEYYKEPPETGSQVLSAGVFYLHELTRLQEAIEEKIHNAKETLVHIYDDGGPQHLMTIPYGKFIDKYSWEGDEISNYHTIVSHTRRVWDELLVKQLGKEELY